MNEGIVSRPLVRYFGGKWRLAPWIISQFPEHKSYVEPFGGAGSVFLRKPRAYHEVYNDLDGEIVNVFRVFQDPLLASELRRLLRFTPFAREEFELAYEPVADPVERARRTVIRAYMGFGSTGTHTLRRTGFRAKGIRSNSASEHDWLSYLDACKHFTTRLQGVVIERRDAFDVITHQDTPETLFYLDPPYLPELRNRRWKGAYRHDLEEADHVRLAELLHQIRGMAIVSGYPSTLYNDIYGDWERTEREARADQGRARTEVLWISPKAKKTAKKNNGSGQISLFRREENHAP